MRKLLILSTLMLMAAGGVLAQDAPRAEVAGNYTFIRFSGGSSCNGAGGSVTGYLNSWFGMTGDFSACHFSGGGSAQTYMFGPRVAYRSSGRVDPYFHLLFGGTHVTGASAFSMTFGGGFDYKLQEHVAVRVAQVDYLMTRFAGVRQNNFRFSAGLVIRIGKK